MASVHNLKGTSFPSFQIGKGNSNIAFAQLLGADGLSSEPLLVFVDSTRANKQLSVDSTVFTYGRNTVNTNAYLRPSVGNDNNSAYVMPYNGTIIRASLITTNNSNQNRSFSIYLNAVETTGVLTTAGAGLQTATNTGVNIDFVAGDTLKLRGRGPGGQIQDTTASLWVRWRV